MQVGIHKGSVYIAVDLLWHSLLGRVHLGEVCSGDGWPAVGHPHGAAVRHADRRRDEKTQYPHLARRRFPLPLGHWKVRRVAALCPSKLWLSTVFHSFFLLVILQGHGAGQGVSQPVGVNISCHWLPLHLWLRIYLVDYGIFLLCSYERVDEIIWVKTNQLQRIIRTGRTGHWLNHGKEHCLVCFTAWSYIFNSTFSYAIINR